MVTAFFSIFFVIMHVSFTLAVIKFRRKLKAAIGNPNKDELLERYIRAHGNFTEQVPLALILIFMTEFLAAPKLLVLVLILLLLIARLSHFFGVTYFESKNSNYKFRIFGMATTFGVMYISGIISFILGFQNIFLN